MIFQAAWNIQAKERNMMHTAVIALGSNLEQPKQQIQQALAHLRQIPEIHDLTASSLYQTAPVGYLNQPDFINAVALIRTSLSPFELLKTLQNIEQTFGRQRSFPNAPRTLDLDIIDFDGHILNTTELTLPHPRAHERAFVMLPLAEIAPDYPIPLFGRAHQLAKNCPNSGIQKLPESINTTH